MTVDLKANFFTCFAGSEGENAVDQYKKWKYSQWGGAVERVFVERRL